MGHPRSVSLARNTVVSLALALSAVSSSAAVLQDWRDIHPQVDTGVFADDKGTKVEFARAEGPDPGESALKMSVSLVEFGGVWTNVKGPLASSGALRFRARASAPGVLEIGLTDRQQVQVVIQVRVSSEEWEEFLLPFALFKPTKYPLPGAPAGKPFDPKGIQGVQFSPRTSGTTTYWIGPLSWGTPGKARTGMPRHDVPAGALVVQDFTLLDKRAYGVFTDGKKGSDLRLDVVRDPERAERQIIDLHYDLKAGGWCGVWLRCGDEWEGQDWSKGRKFVFTVHTTEALSLEFGFNDVNGNAYVALAPQTKGNGWETLSFPLDSFQLNPYWQPPEAKKGAPRDLSSIETFNIAPKTAGPHSFRIREVQIGR